MRTMWSGGLDIFMNQFTMATVTTCLFALPTLNDTQCRTLFFIFRFVTPPCPISFFRNIHAHTYTVNLHVHASPHFVSTCRADWKSRSVHSVHFSTCSRMRFTSDSDDPQFDSCSSL